MSPAFSPGVAAGSPHSGASRGGRPRDWNDSRGRQLVRMYVYTENKMDIMLEAIRDRHWAPQKDAANKVLHKCLGNDPRWLRPKSKAESKQQIKALENSTRPVFRQPAAGSLTAAGAMQLDTSNLEGNALALNVDAPMSGVSPNPDNNRWSSSPYSLSSPNGWQTSLQSATFAYSGPIEWPQLPRRNSALSDVTVSSMASSFLERLTVKGASPSDAADLWKLSRRFTAPRSATSSPSLSSPLRASPPGHQAFPSADMPLLLDQSRAGYAVAGDFINIGHGFSFEGDKTCDKTSEAHDNGNCWCAVSEQLFNHFQSMPSARIVLAPDAQAVWALRDINTAARDEFGHSALHLLASLEHCHSQLLSVVAEALTGKDQVLSAANTARQTFLHMLHPSWFLPGSQLENLIHILKQSHFDILGRDVFGRNVFHIMREHNVEFQRLQGCALGLNPKVLNVRDAFGRMPLRALPSGPSLHAARSIRRVIAARRLTASSSDGPPTIESDSRIIAQTKLLKIIYAATATDSSRADPTMEDLEGRNGFHALAEVILGVTPMIDHVSRGQKRKHDEPTIDQPNPEPMPRITHLEALIDAKVDINHHNVAGDTPLMTFVVQLSDGKTKAENVEVRGIINGLVGAGAEMERRNRRGETALLVAARHGQKVAVDALLKLGANPYVRNSEGQSALDVVDSMWRVSEAAMGSYEACRKLLCGGQALKSEPKQSPSIFDEWTFGVPTVSTS
ncbi:ankyrin repeat-containing domain protein [Microdochium trichocladiopsis]|uniref:Ankyrin repeat-containing domain protein n=1 Tax=Microdochium trichocladiopsis TaxID=1682393 RepID=A0A9P8YIF7_9PEZI|nr:ankyrin repeat-containing domain protein [Microdochium trichocladiopsis]KAH7040613.1 ankyrin repeat-containing domain protein [Microdochium trichocladiopsis]